MQAFWREMATWTMKTSTGPSVTSPSSPWAWSTWFNSVLPVDGALLVMLLTSVVAGRRPIWKHQQPYSSFQLIQQHLQQVEWETERTRITEREASWQGFAHLDVTNNRTFHFDSHLFNFLCIPARSPKKKISCSKFTVFWALFKSKLIWRISQHKNKIERF